MSARSVALVAVGLGALVILTNLPLLTGTAFPIWDGDAAYAPWQMFVGDAARDLRLLVWNPWSNGGSPDGFDPQFGARSPLHLLIGLVFGGSLAGYYALWLSTWWLSGVGMLLLCRWLGASAPAAALAALAFSFSGFQLCHGQHMSFVLVYASMPFVVWRLDVALCHRRLLPVAESAAIFGLASLGGYPGVSVVSVLFLGLFALGRLGLGSDREASGWPDARGAKPAWLARGAILWGAVALVAAAPTTLGLAYEARGFSDRSEAVTFERAVGQNAMMPAALLSAFGPAVASAKTADRNRWPGTDISSMSFYLGAVPLWLAICGLLLARRRATVVWLAALGLLGLGLAMGTTLPLRGWLYEVFPPSRYFRHASIFRAWFELAFALGAALGWRELAQWWRGGPRHGWRRAAPAVAAFALALGAAGQGWIVGRGAALPGATGLALHGVLVWSTLLGLASWLCFTPHRTGARLGGVAPLLCALAIADLSATAWLQRPLRMDAREETAQSWREVAERRQRGFDLIALDTPREFSSEIFPVNTNKNLLQRIPTLRNYSPLLNRFHRTSVRDLHAIPWAIGEDRIWFVPKNGAGFVALSDANQALVASRFATRRHRILPLHRPDDVLAPVPEGEAGPRDQEDAATLARMSPAARLPHRILTYQPDRLVIEVTAPRAGYAIVTDRWARGWKARVDGRDTMLLGASFVFRAVLVPPGTHTIEMTYEPRSHAPLSIASWGTLCAVAFASGTSGLRRRNP